MPPPPRAIVLSLLVVAPVACQGRYSLPPDARFAAEVAVGDGFACARMKDGTTRCWGKNEAGQLGDGTREVRGETVVAQIPAKTVHALATGDAHACAAADMGLWCWGKNDAGQLGGPVAPGQPALVRVGSVSAVELALGARHSCARSEAGDVTCWGANDAGQLGAPGASAEPRVVPNLRARALAAGGDATCAIAAADGAVWCWGRVPGGSSSEVARVEGTAGARSLAVGPSHACAALEDGSVACWGQNDDGQLGDGTFTPRARATHVPGMTGVVRVAVGRRHTCTLMHDATIFCWGANDASQLADGTNAHRAAPELISGVVEVTAIAAGGDATCARYSNGSARCWGELLLPKTGVVRVTVPMEVRW